MKVNATEDELRDLIRQGYCFPEILAKTGVTSRYLLRVFVEYVDQNRQPKLGNKTEPYYPDEKSMTIPTYTYDDLCYGEQKIYNDLENQETVGGES